MPNRTAPHTQLLADIEQYVALQGGWTLRIAGGMTQRKGSPDIVCFIVHHGWPIALFLEAKTGKSTQSTAQVAVQREIDSHGGYYFVIRSLEGLEDALLAIGLCRHRLTDRRIG